MKEALKRQLILVAEYFEASYSPTSSVALELRAIADDKRSQLETDACKTLTDAQLEIISKHGGYVSLVEEWAAFCPPYYAVFDGEIIAESEDEETLLEAPLEVVIYDSVGCEYHGR